MLIIDSMPEAASLVQNQPQSPAPSTPSSGSKVKLLLILAFLFVLGVVGFVAFQVFNTKGEQEEKIVTGLERDEVRLGWSDLTGTYPTNDPSPLAADTQFNDVVFDKLVELKGSSIVPELATKWTNPNPLTWRFEIRKKVKFSSGDELVAEDIKYSVDQLIKTVDDDNPWPTSLDTAIIKEVRVVDADTVEIETKEADSAFLHRLLSVFVVSKKQIERDGIAKAAGSGPYKVTSYEKDKRAEVVINENYWGAKPKVKKGVFIVYSTDKELLAALRKGEIDYAHLSGASLSVPSGFQVKKIEEPRVSMLFFNFASSNKTFLTKNLREAVKLAIDQNSLIKEASVSAQPANQFITRSIVGYNSKLPEQKANVEKAKSLVAVNAPASLSLDIFTTPDREALAAAIEKQLAKIGIKVEVKVEEEFNTLVGKLFSGEAQSFIAGPTATDGGEYIDVIFKTEGNSNLLSYSDKEVDELSKKINETFNPTQRRTLLEEAVEKIIEDVPVVPLYADTGTFVMRDNFDFTLNAYTDFHLDDVSGREVRVGDE